MYTPPQFTGEQFKSICDIARVQFNMTPEEVLAGLAHDCGPDCLMCAAEKNGDN